MFTTKNLLILIGRHAAIALATVGIAWVVSFFLARETTRVADTVVQNRHLATTLEKRTELFSTLARDAQVVGTNDTLLDHAFISSDNIFEFISTFENLALRNGATQSFHFENPSPSSISTPFPISAIGYSDTLSLSVQGLTQYIKDFDTLPYFTKINNLTITSGDPAGWRGTSSISFRATLYAKTIQ